MSWAARSLGPPKRVKNVRVVRQPDRLQTPLLLAALAAGVVIIVPLLANIWGHAEAVRLGYLIEATRERKAELEERNRQLRAEYASRRDLALIEKQAARELGLQPRSPSTTVVVNRAQDAGTLAGAGMNDGTGTPDLTGSGEAEVIRPGQVRAAGILPTGRAPERREANGGTR